MNDDKKYDDVNEFIKDYLLKRKTDTEEKPVVIYPRSLGLNFAREHIRNHNRIYATYDNKKTFEGECKLIIMDDSYPDEENFKQNFKRNLESVAEYSKFGISSLSSMIKCSNMQKTALEFSKSMAIKPSNRVGRRKDHASGRLHHVVERYKDEMIDNKLHHIKLKSIIPGDCEFIMSSEKVDLPLKSYSEQDSDTMQNALILLKEAEVEKMKLELKSRRDSDKLIEELENLQGFKVHALYILEKAIALVELGEDDESVIQVIKFALAMIRTNESMLFNSLRKAKGKHLDKLALNHDITREPDESDEGLRRRYAKVIMGIKI